jgi:hypothetical protein
MRFPVEEAVCIIFCPSSSGVQKGWKKSAAGITKAPIISAPTSGQIPAATDVAPRMSHSRSGVTRAVDQLERKGLVERCVFEGDKRGSLATLTAEGKAFLRTETRLHLIGVGSISCST